MTLVTMPVLSGSVDAVRAMRMRRASTTLFVAVALLLNHLASAQTANEVVRWTTHVDTARRLRSGQTIWVSLVAEIEPGWRVYAMTQTRNGPSALAITVPPNPAFREAGRAIGPKAFLTYDSTFQMPVEFYKVTATFRVPLVIDSDSDNPHLQGNSDVRFQACSDRLCLLPTTVHVPLRES